MSDFADVNARLLVVQWLIFLVLILCFIAWRLNVYLEFKKKHMLQSRPGSQKLRHS